MIVQCPDCTTRYQLDPERVPPERIRVRCPKCRYVFPIDGTLARTPTASGVSTPVAPVVTEPAPEAASAPVAAVPDESVAPPQPAPEPVTEPAAEPAAAQADEPADEDPVETPVPEAPATDTVDPSALDLEIERPSPTVTPTAAQPAAPAEDSSVAVAEAEPKPEPAAAPDPAEEDPQRKKARRLARALVSDILVYNRETRDKALAEGNLVQALGAEIKKSWELYKERVTPEVANSNNDFREALNDILADGQKIF